MLRKQCKTVSIRYDEEFCFDWKYTKETMDCGVSTEGNDKVVIYNTDEVESIKCLIAEYKNKYCCMYIHKTTCFTLLT